MYKRDNEFLDMCIKMTTRRVICVMLKHDIDINELAYEDQETGFGMKFDINVCKKEVENEREKSN